MKHRSDCGQIAGQIRIGCFAKNLVFLGFFERSMEARRLHQRGHRKVTNGNQTRWITPAGLCISTQLNQRDRELANFPGSQTAGRAR
jgi:hypothetical protein